MYLKRRNPNSVHPVRLLYPYFGFRETATGSTMSLKGRDKMERDSPRLDRAHRSALYLKTCKLWHLQTAPSSSKARLAPVRK